MIFGDEAARDRRGVERNAGGLHERLEGGGPVGPPDATARDDHRPLRLAQERNGVLDGGGIAEGARRGAPRGRIDHALLLDLLPEHVAGQIEVHGAGASRGRLAQRRLHHVGNAPRIVDPLRPLGDGTEHRDLVDLLEGLHAEEDARARATDGEHGRRVGEGVGDAGEEVGRPGTGAAHAHSRAPGEPCPRVGGEGGRLLVAVIDGPDAELDASGLRLQHGPAHEIEHRVHALRPKGLRQHFGSGDRRHERSPLAIRRARRCRAGSSGSDSA